MQVQWLYVVLVCCVALISVAAFLWIVEKVISNFVTLALRIKVLRDKSSEQVSPIDPLTQQLVEFRNTQFAVIPKVRPQNSWPEWKNPDGVPPIDRTAIAKRIDEKRKLKK